MAGVAGAAGAAGFIVGGGGVTPGRIGLDGGGGVTGGGVGLEGGGGCAGTGCIGREMGGGVPVDVGAPPAAPPDGDAGGVT
jgi:hypothetical protein